MGVEMGGWIESPSITIQDAAKELGLKLPTTVPGIVGTALIPDLMGNLELYVNVDVTLGTFPAGIPTTYSGHFVHIRPVVRLVFAQAKKEWWEGKKCTCIECKCEFTLEKGAQVEGPELGLGQTPVQTPCPNCKCKVEV